MLRASFQTGPKSILYLFLAFAFYGKASNATFTELGCEFVNNEYKMERHSNNTSPIWSKKEIESNMELPIDPNDSYWQPIVDYLSEVSVMNDLSPFTKFVKTYKTNHSDNESLESFFDNYDFPFQLNETRDPASHIIQMFHKLKDNHRNQPKKPVLEHYYLVSAWIDPSDTDISIAMSYFSAYDTNGSNVEYTKRLQLVQKMLKTRVQDHLAGIIKITNGRRTGYILIDPGYANGEKLVQPFAVFLMEDRQYPHQAFLNGVSSYDEIQFTYTKENNIPFILAKHRNFIAVTKVLYYFGQPYCSFIENTIKANLLRLNHGIIASDSKKQKQGHLMLKISRDDNPLILKMIDNTRTGHLRVRKQTMSLTNLNETILENAAVQIIHMVLGISTEEVATITEELKYIQTALFKDYKFMSMIIDLSKKLNLDKEPKEEPVKYPKIIPIKEETESRPGKAEPLPSQTQSEPVKHANRIPSKEETESRPGEAEPLPGHKRSKKIIEAMKKCLPPFKPLCTSLKVVNP